MVEPVLSNKQRRKEEPAGAILASEISASAQEVIGGSQEQKLKEKLRELCSADVSLASARAAWPSWILGFDKLFAHMLTDSRDTVFVYWMLYFTLVMPLSCFVVYQVSAAFPGSWLWVLAGFLHLFVYMRYLPFSIAILHNNVHAPLFNPRKTPTLLHLIANNYMSIVMMPFFGNTPETYHMHHVKMHHVEDNEPSDLSSTMRFQRDSILEFARYYGRFYFFGLYDLTRYFLNKGQVSYVARSVIGEMSYHLLGLMLLYTNWRAAIFLYAIPYNITRVGMLSGNWIQHAFIAQQMSTSADGQQAMQPHNTSVITCIHTHYNIVSFNDGYHLNHHEHAQKHWADQQSYFLDVILNKNRLRTTDEGCIVFRDVDYHQIFFYLMTKRYSSLAKYVVHVDPLKDEEGNVVPQEDEQRVLKYTEKMLRDRVKACKI